MKKLLLHILDRFILSVFICLCFDLVMFGVAIALDSGEALADSIRGWDGTQVFLVLYGLPLAWALVMVALEKVCDKLNSPKKKREEEVPLKNW